MNHIGDQEPELIDLALPHLSALAPDDNVAEWSHDMAVQNRERRPFEPQILWGHDLVLDWALLGLRIKECSNTPGRAPTPTEKKHFVVRETELTHEQVADLVADYRAAR
jgi:hypothetical protein